VERHPVETQLTVEKRVFGVAFNRGFSRKSALRVSQLTEAERLHGFGFEAPQVEVKIKGFPPARQVVSFQRYIVIFALEVHCKTYASRGIVSSFKAEVAERNLCHRHVQNPEIPE